MEKRLSLKKQLLGCGFDLIQPFVVNEYNAQVGIENQLPFYYDQRNLGILIGNSKVLWSYFLEWLNLHPQWRERTNPLDEYVCRHIEEIRKELPWPTLVRYSHRPEPSHIAFQKIAHLSGLAYLTKSHLCVHPVLGPWFSLRAILIPELRVSFYGKRGLENPCAQCDWACYPAFEAALENQKGMDFSAMPIKQNWQSWLKIRTACPLGKQYQFSEPQTKYHYTKDKRLL